MSLDSRRIKKVVAAASDDLLTRLALQVAGQTKANIVANDQVDTGFMLNTVYTLTPDGKSTYGETWESGNYLGRKTGEMEARDKVFEPAAPEENEALIGVAADYAVFQEIENSFLFRALEQVLGQAAEAVREVGRKHLG